MWGNGKWGKHSALQRRGRGVGCEASGNDDSTGDSQLLAREVDRLNDLLALQLLDQERVAINTASVSTRHPSNVSGVHVKGC